MLSHPSSMDGTIEPLWSSWSSPVLLCLCRVRTASMVSASARVCDDADRRSECDGRTRGWNSRWRVCSQGIATARVSASHAHVLAGTIEARWSRVALLPRAPSPAGTIEAGWSQLALFLAVMCVPSPHNLYGPSYRACVWLTVDPSAVGSTAGARVLFTGAATAWMSEGNAHMLCSTRCSEHPRWLGS